MTTSFSWVNNLPGPLAAPHELRRGSFPDIFETGVQHDRSATEFLNRNACAPRGPSDPRIKHEESSKFAPAKMEGEPGGLTRRTLRRLITQVVDPLETLDELRLFEVSFVRAVVPCAA